MLIWYKTALKVVHGSVVLVEVLNRSHTTDVCLLCEMPGVVQLVAAVF